MKRLYIKRTGTNLTITHRASHEIIGFADMSDKAKAKKFISELCALSTEDYTRKILSLGVRLRADKQGLLEVSKDSEDWYEKAWSTVTISVLKELGLKDIIPEDNITHKEIEDIRRALKEPKKTIESTKKSLPKKSLKKVVKEHTEPVKSIKKEYTEDELRKLFRDKKITVDEYRTMRLELRGKKTLPKKKAK